MSDIKTQAEMPISVEYEVLERAKKIWEDGYFSSEIQLIEHGILFAKMGFIAGRESLPKEDMVKAMEAAVPIGYLAWFGNDSIDRRPFYENNDKAANTLQQLKDEGFQVLPLYSAPQSYLSPLEAENKRLKEVMQEAADHLFNMPTECLLDAKLVIGQANIMLSKALNP